MTDTSSLRLLAESPADIEIVAAAVQDAVVKAGNLKYESKRNRFYLELNRYRWEAASGKRKEGERVRSLLAFDGVLSVRTRAVTKTDPEMILSILDITFEAGQEVPAGTVKILFAGDGELELAVEVLDVTLLDSDYVWPTRNRPSHERRKS